MIKCLTHYAPEGVLSLTPELFSDLYNDIKDFRELFRLPVAIGLTETTKKLHEDLYAEEFFELVLARTKVDAIDAIVDQVYVMMGRVVNAGSDDYEGFRKEESNLFFFKQLDLLLRASAVLKFDFCEAWNIVHASNLSKVCVGARALEATYEKYVGRLQIEIHHEPVEPTLLQRIFGSASEAWVVKASKDCHDEELNFYPRGKVLKSAEYTAADLSAL